MFIILLGGHGSFYIMFTIFDLFCSLTCSPLYVVSEVLGATQQVLAIKELGNNGLRVPSILWWFWMFRQAQMVCDWFDGYWHFVDVWWCFALVLLVLLVLWLQTVNSAFVWFVFISHSWMCPEAYMGWVIVSGLQRGCQCPIFPERILRWPRSCVSMDSPCPCNTEFEDCSTGCPIDFWKAYMKLVSLVILMACYWDILMEVYCNAILTGFTLLVSSGSL